MDEEKKQDYLNERISENRSRVLISTIASVLILACALFMVYYIKSTRGPIIAPDDSEAVSQTSPSQDTSLTLSETSDIVDSIPSSETSESFSSAESQDESAEESNDESTVQQTVYGKTYNNIYVYGNTAVSLLSGSSSNQTKFAQAVNNYAEKLGDKVNVYACVVPTYVEFYRNGEGNKVSTASQSDIITSIYSELNESVIAVDAYSVLGSHTDEYLYYRTDPNWTPLGAYYAYTALAEAFGESATLLSSFESDTISEFLGENYNSLSVKLNQLKDEPDYITFYKTDLLYPSTVTHYYSDGTVRENTQMVYKSVSNPITYGYMIFGCRGTYTSVKTQNKNGKKLLVLADDTRSALSPFLMAHFEELHIGEIRTFYDQTGKTLKKFVDENGITDVLIMTYTGNARNTYRINDLNELLGE